MSLMVQMMTPELDRPSLPTEVLQLSTRELKGAAMSFDF